MEQILGLLIGGIAGGAGGGKIVKGSDMGALVNMIAGAVGALGGGQIFGNLLNSGAADAAAAAGGMDIGALAANLVGGGFMGMVLQIVVGLVLKRMRG